MKRKCPICSKDFVTLSSQKVYCTHECYIKSRYIKDVEAKIRQQKALERARAILKED